MDNIDFFPSVLPITPYCKCQSDCLVGLSAEVLEVLSGGCTLPQERTYSKGALYSKEAVERSGGAEILKAPVSTTCQIKMNTMHFYIFITVI